MGFVFTAHDARQVLIQSEGKPDYRGKHVGHAIARHVRISRAGLLERMYLKRATNADMPVYTAFTSVADQAAAVAEAINAAESAERMSRFFHPDRVLPGERRELAKVVLRNAVAVRVGLGGDGHVTRMAPFVTVRLSKFPGRHRDMHIETAFAVFGTGEIG